MFIRMINRNGTKAIAKENNVGAYYEDQTMTNKNKKCKVKKNVCHCKRHIPEVSKPECFNHVGRVDGVGNECSS